MRNFLERVVISLMFLTVSGICINTVIALEPTGMYVSIDTDEQFHRYCLDGNFSGTLQLNKDIDIGSDGFSIVNNNTGSRQLAIDLNGHDIIAPIREYDCSISVSANTTLFDSLKKGSVIFQKISKNEILPYGTASIETFGYFSDDSDIDYHADVLLRLENISISCLDKDLEAVVQTGLPGTSLELINCSLNDVQIKNNCGNCLIQGSQVKLERDNQYAVQSIATPTMSGSSAGDIYWEEPWLDDNLQIKDSRIFITGKKTIGVEFQGCSMKVENSIISATGNDSVGILYGEFLFGSREAVQPNISNSYISGLLRAIQYSKKDGNSTPIISDYGSYYYPDERIDLPGAYKDGDGNIQQTENDTKVLYPINGKMVTGFVDVNPDSWYADAVMALYQQHIINGTSNEYFSPDIQLSRGMVATCIWRIENEPVVNYAIRFDDVTNDQYYSEAVRWAASEGIVVGYDKEHFGPNDVVTREQLAAILYRYAQRKGGGFTDNRMFLLDMADRDSISDWAYESACWMTKNGIIKGKPNKVFDPQGNATRSQFAMMLQRFNTVISEFVNNNG